MSPAKLNNSRHDGAEGHWLETQMGVKKNSKNEPDLLDHEMKNHTKLKTTFSLSLQHSSVSTSKFRFVFISRWNNKLE